MDDLSRHFADLATTLLGARTVDETMAIIVHSAVATIDGCDHASLSYLRGRDLVSASSDDETGPILDGLQTETGEGPCLYAARTGEIHRASDLQHDGGYAEYGPRAVAATGVLSSIASPLHVGERVIGVLNLFSTQRDAFRTGDVDRAALLAIFVAHATPALWSALERANLEEALRTRDLIGQAKGMLRATTKLTDAEAFGVLSRASQRLNVKLVEVARRIVEREPAGVPPLPPRESHPQA